MALKTYRDGLIEAAQRSGYVVVWSKDHLSIFRPGGQERIYHWNLGRPTEQVYKAAWRSMASDLLYGGKTLLN